MILVGIAFLVLTAAAALIVLSREGARVLAYVIVIAETVVALTAALAWSIRWIPDNLGLGLTLGSLLAIFFGLRVIVPLTGGPIDVDSMLDEVVELERAFQRNPSLESSELEAHLARIQEAAPRGAETFARLLAKTARANREPSIAPATRAKIRRRYEIEHRRVYSWWVTRHPEVDDPARARSEAGL